MREKNKIILELEEVLTTLKLKYSFGISVIEFWTLGVSFPLCVMQLGRGRYVKPQMSLYPIYYADGDDMFRPLWAIFRSQNI